VQTTVGVGQGAATALTRMNEDFMNLDLAHLLVVACINEYDTTAPARP
jgi:hypothetical protein